MFQVSLLTIHVGGKTHTFKKASIASLKMEEPGRATKTDEPIWIKQHAAKLEVEKSKVSSTTSVPPPEEKTAPCTAVEKSKAHRVKSKGKESLWDSPLFDRKHSLSLSGDGNRKGSGSNLIGKEQHGLTVGPVLSHAVKSKESISSRIEEVDRLLKDPIITKENSEDDLKSKCGFNSTGFKVKCICSIFIFSCYLHAFKICNV